MLLSEFKNDTMLVEFRVFVKAVKLLLNTKCTQCRCTLGVHIRWLIFKTFTV